MEPELATAIPVKVDAADPVVVDPPDPEPEPEPEPEPDPEPDPVPAAPVPTAPVPTAVGTAVPVELAKIGTREETDAGATEAALLRLDATDAAASELAAAIEATAELGTPLPAPWAGTRPPFGVALAANAEAPALSILLVTEEATELAEEALLVDEATEETALAETVAEEEETAEELLEEVELQVKS